MPYRFHTRRSVLYNVGRDDNKDVFLLSFVPYLSYMKPALSEYFIDVYRYNAHATTLNYPFGYLDADIPLTKEDLGLT